MAVNNETNRQFIVSRLPVQRHGTKFLIHVILIDNGDGTSSLYLWDTDNASYASDPAALAAIVNAGLISGEVQPLTITGMVFVAGDGAPGVLPVFNGTHSLTNSRFSQGDSGGSSTLISGPTVGNAIELLNSGEVKVSVKTFGFDVYGSAGGAPWYFLIPDGAALGSKGMAIAVSLDGNTLSITDKLLNPIVDVTAAGLVKLSKAGAELQVKEGANCSMGQSTLVGGTVLVNNTLVKANTRIFLSRSTVAGVPGNLSYTIVADTSFTIVSDNVGDLSVVNWLLVQAL